MTVPDYTRKNLFIGGRWCAPQSLDVQHLHEAATGKPLGTTPLAGAADIDRAVHAARTAFDSGPWPTMAVSERATYFVRMPPNSNREATSQPSWSVGRTECPRWCPEAPTSRPRSPS